MGGPLPDFLRLFHRICEAMYIQPMGLGRTGKDSPELLQKSRFQNTEHSKSAESSKIGRHSRLVVGQFLENFSRPQPVSVRYLR